MAARGPPDAARFPSTPATPSAAIPEALGFAAVVGCKDPSTPVLLLILGVAAVLRVWCALAWEAGYDEMWHIFEAAETSLVGFLRELAHDPHPPLHVLLLTPLVRDASVFWPRLLSILAALAHVPLIFLLARRLEIARPVAWLSGLLVGLSFCDITLGVAVRSYALAVVFLMAGLWGLLGLLQPGSRRRDVVAALGSVLALCSLYAAALPVLAVCLALLVLGLAQRFDLRLSLGRTWQMARWPELVGFLALLLAVIAWFLINRHHYPKPVYLRAHVLGDDEQVLAFVGRNAMHILRDFTPLGLAPDFLEPVLAGVAVLILVFLGWRYLRAPDHAGRGRALVLVSLVFLGGILALLAIANLYAFGGKMRHQFVLFPFLHLALAMALDEAWRTWTHVVARTLLWVGVLGIAVWSLVISFKGPGLDDFPAEPLWQVEIQQLAANVQDRDHLYLRQFAFYGVQGRLRQLGYRWRHLPSDFDHVDVLELEATAKRFTVLRDRAHWQMPSWPDTASMEGLRELMVRRSLSRVWVFERRQEGQTDLRPTPDRQAELGRVCKEVGLQLVSAMGTTESSLYLVQRGQ